MTQHPDFMLDVSPTAAPFKDQLEAAGYRFAWDRSQGTTPPSEMVLLWAVEQLVRSHTELHKRVERIEAMLALD